MSATSRRRTRSGLWKQDNSHESTNLVVNKTRTLHEEGIKLITLEADALPLHHCFPQSVIAAKSVNFRGFYFLLLILTVSV